MHPAVDPSDLLNRGVWLVPYTVDGCWVLVAVNGRHERVAERHIDDLRFERAARRDLEDVLNRVDPLPRLRLVRDGEATPAWTPATEAAFMAYRRTHH